MGPKMATGTFGYTGKPHLHAFIARKTDVPSPCLWLGHVHNMVY